MDVDHRDKIYSKLGLYFIGVTGGLAFITTAVTIPFLTPAFRRICLPFVPATETQISNILTALKGRSGTLVDLGSGDGRIVIAAAHAGFQAVGVELNHWLVLYSRFVSFYKGYSTRFIRRNLWKVNLNTYSNVVIFGTESMMNQIEEKLNNEMLNKSVVVACRYPLPTLKPVKTIGEGIDSVWKYVINKD